MNLAVLDRLIDWRLVLLIRRFVLITNIIDFNRTEVSERTGKNGIAATHGNEVRAEAAVLGALCLVLGCKTRTRSRALAQ